MALLAPAMLFASVRLAIAQDATWVGGTAGNDYSSGANWTPATTPTGTATFATNTNNNIPISLLATVGAWSFTGTSAYTFTIGGNSEVSFTGAGINVGGGSVNIINNWALFQNSSTAGSASITNNAQTAFLNSSSAGAASIINNGTVQFSQSSTAGSATVTTNNAAIVHFLDTSTGGNARFITNTGGKFDMSALTQLRRHDRRFDPRRGQLFPRLKDAHCR